MAVNPTVLEIKAKISGLQGLNQLKSSLRKLGTESVNAENTLKGYTAEIVKFAQKTGNSINSLEAQKKAFETLRRSVDVTGDEFKQAGIELDKLDKKLAKAEGRKQGGGRLRGAAQIAGTVAGAGVFGGPEGAIGALAGSAFGPSGAIVGGAIGAQVGQVRKAIGGIAEYGAELSKLRIALKGVTESEVEYNRTLELISQSTKDFAIPQSILTRQFTRLQASVKGAGGSVADTNTAFKGIVAAVRATGGSLQDVDSALTATSQVFSKGKVSAEELRQQIGERLPGAFTLFAESIGKTPQELDKALEGGKVTLDDFLTFSKSLFEEFGETAQIIADGPEGAGDRLAVSLEELNEKISPELSRLGAQFQNFANNAITALTRLFDFLGQVGQSFEEKVDGTQIERQRKALVAAKQTLVRTNLTDLQRDFATSQIKQLQPIIDAYDFIGPTFSSSKGFGKPLEETKKTEGRKGRTRTPADRRPAALEKLRKLMLKVNREFVDIGTEATKVGANARTKILLEREQAYQKILQQDQDRIFIIRQVSAVTGEAYEDEIAKVEKLKRARISLINQQVDEQLFAQRLSQFGMDQKSFDQNGQAITGLDQQAFPTGVDSILNPNKLRESIQEMKKGLEELVNPVNQIVGAANAIGDSFAQSFKSVIDGSATTQEALASFFQNLSNYFLDMATQIIAEMVKIAILNAVTGLLPGLGSSGAAGAPAFGGLGNGSFFGGGGGALDFSSNFGLNLLNAKGNAFDKGLVTSPTVFAYANGGAGNFGLLGEAGPEAIMPLSRGSDGKLGVKSSGGGTVINITNNIAEGKSTSRSSGSDSQGISQLSKMMVAVIQREQRPGGVLNR
jgi:tape measure domain-containing protein